MLPIAIGRIRTQSRKAATGGARHCNEVGRRSQRGEPRGEGIALHVRKLGQAERQDMQCAVTGLDGV